MAAFVPTAGLGVPSTSAFTGASVQRAQVVSARRPTRSVVRASIQEENRKAKEAAEYRGPQGFTSYSEKVNGRMAMIGFVVGLMTEIINPAHPSILKQVESLVDFVPFVHAASMNL
mmetsp:Transcript_11733/g.28615  ORF Transcript_11733/g.28615 Transcript_11733/m.28615 type:complete len:116 (+) Transcript_11733:423-770(+)|eukprot:CAMPEP_0198367958 /NCGR_PEP_ID=MMETSP1450-20131203/155452_1 /TAXON_ID=753684 ORGANISM="Madagascaria erythrocladiodes, Strain CCMP3234" /NCGR_SAMPLE_ID=MMETSP1450 /ASSEMBLY_ACC=CAM_ASM_001115 /LENGTH=115 /DNA_ID=CAMNT_0044075453 /DNA_START=125 /DNA_END=472 /DNA_ORIENTATION=-